MPLDLTFGAGGGGGGASSGDYVKDSFKDTSLPATNNSGLTSSASTNPMSQLFGNDDAPKYSIKTLFVKGLKLIEDRALWLNNKPTYEIEWTETFPGVYGYVCGDARVISFANSVGSNILIRNASDFIGITGNIRNVLWQLNPSTQTSATAMRVTDGSDTSTIDFSSLSSDAIGRGVNHFAGFVHSTSNATDELHDFRLRAVQNDTLSVAAVTVFVENATNNIKIFPGSTYVDKTKITTSGGITTMALPTGDTTTGFASVVYKTAQGYGVTTQSITALVTGATGSSGTNSVTVTTGTGASFRAGMGFVAQQGSSMHVSNVVTVSTDTLTFGSTLPFSLSGATLWRAWYAGPTLAINSSFFIKAFELDPIMSSNPIETASFGASTSGNYIYSHPERRFRAWGSLQFTTAYNGIPVLRPLGATTGFLQVTGDFQAAEIEWMGLGASSVLHGTFGVNGLAAYGQNQAFTGIIKQTVFTDAQNGWNSFVFSPGSSFLDCGITKVNLYQLRSPIGPTLGRLAEFRDLAGFAHRSAYNATMIPLGLSQRHYVDEFFFQGAWARSATTAAVGGVRFIGTSTNSVLRFQYYGQNFNILGTAGTSSILTLDGASIAVSFNAINSVATLGFHTLQFTCQSGTHLIEAIDVLRPKTQIKNLQNFSPLSQLADIAKTYIQSDTPRNAKNGDWWLEVPLTAYTQPRAWIRVAGYWLQMAVNTLADDPHFDELFMTGGLTDASSSTTLTTFKYNATSWASSVNNIVLRYNANKCNSAYNGMFYIASGIIGASVDSSTQIFNKTAWASVTNITNQRGYPASYSAFGFYYVSKGTSDGTAANSTTNAQKWNGSAWGSGTAWSNANYVNCSAVVASLLQSFGGVNTAGSPVTNNELRTSADSVSSGTVLPIAMDGHVGSNVNAGIGISSMGPNGAIGSSSYTWNGSAWSSALTAPYSSYNGSGAFSAARNLFFAMGGDSNGSGLPTTSNFQYNGVSFTSNGALVAARRNQISGAF